MLTSEEKNQLARLNNRAAKHGLVIRHIDENSGYYAFVNLSTNMIVFDSPRTNNLDAFEQALDDLDAQDDTND